MLPTDSQYRCENSCLLHTAVCITSLFNVVFPDEMAKGQECHRLFALTPSRQGLQLSTSVDFGEALVHWASPRSSRRPACVVARTPLRAAKSDDERNKNDLFDNILRNSLDGNTTCSHLAKDGNATMIVDIWEVLRADFISLFQDMHGLPIPTLRIRGSFPGATERSFPGR